MNKRKLLPFFSILLALTLALLPACAWAYSGRTDSSGGHKDNKNKSGLGSYHYHCGGNPAHLHPNGVCPYSASSLSKSSSSSKSSGTSSASGVSSGASAFQSSSTQDIDALIREYVQQEIFMPSIDPDTLEESVNILLGYANKTVNVRQQPDSSSKKIGYIPKNEKILVLQTDYTDGWHQMLFDDQIGYLSAKYCDLMDIITKSVAISGAR